MRSERAVPVKPDLHPPTQFLPASASIKSCHERTEALLHLFLYIKKKVLMYGRISSFVNVTAEVYVNSIRKE